MITKINKNQDRLKRHKRVRGKVKGDAVAPRLSVYRTLNHIYAQLIDDVKSNTLVTRFTRRFNRTRICGEKPKTTWF